MKGKKRRHGVWLLRGAGLFLALMILTGSCLAAEGEPGRRSLIPVGQTIGIKLFAKGVMVVGLSEVTGESGTSAPAKECGLQEGDIITHINDAPVDTIEAVEEQLRLSQGLADVTAVRKGRQLKLTAHPSVAQGSYKLGAWIRDSMAGIGTVTFYDPQTGVFGALGHGIADVDTGLLMPLKEGAVLPVWISGRIAGEKGCPGQLHGRFQLDTELGELTANTQWGIFGKMKDHPFSGRPVPTAQRGEIKTGPAEILANVEADQVKAYSVEILRVYSSPGPQGQDLMLKVTDPQLLELTGGIVQGMSGSPILQDGRLVGAVTHVLVNDPTRGYGIFIEHMLEAGR